MDLNSSKAMLGACKDDLDNCDNPRVGDTVWTQPIDMKEPHYKEPTWWEKEGPGLEMRDWGGAVINIFYICLLLAEFVLWIKVFLMWRSDPESPGYSMYILLPLLLPTILLPVLAILHSLVMGRLSYSSALLLLPPPSPIIIHMIILYRKIAREEHIKLSLAVRVTGFVQSVLMSFPLVVFSLMTLVKSTVMLDKVVMEQIHHHLFQYNIQPLAASLSLINLLVSTVRFNERETGRAVVLLSGVPFNFTNIGFRLIGFCLLFTFVDPLWILISVFVLFCVSIIGVQLAAGQSICYKMYRKCSQSVSQSDQPDDLGVVVCLLLSLVNILVPAGYNSDRYLGHSRGGGGWKLILVTWLGSVVVVSLVINHCLTTHIPNIFTGVAPVDMSMVIPKTGLDVNIPNIAMGGLNIKLVLPKTQMSMLGDNPASFELVISSEQDMILGLVVPLLLVLVTVPFTILRLLLLGWDCRLVRQEKQNQEGPQSAGRTRNFLTVCCGLSAMMMFTTLLAILVTIYVLIIIQTTLNPLVRETK